MPAFEVVIHKGPLPALGEGALSDAENAFRAALEGAGVKGSKYTRWASKTRAEWMAARGLRVRGEGEWR